MLIFDIDIFESTKGVLLKTKAVPSFILSFLSPFLFLFLFCRGFPSFALDSHQIRLFVRHREFFFAVEAEFFAVFSQSEIDRQHSDPQKLYHSKGGEQTHLTLSTLGSIITKFVLESANQQ